MSSNTKKEIKDALSQLPDSLLRESVGRCADRPLVASISLVTQTEGVIERRGYEEFTGLISDELISKTLEFFNGAVNEENNSKSNNNNNSNGGTDAAQSHHTPSKKEERSHKHKNEEDPSEALEKVMSSKGLDVFLESCDLSLLRSFCVELGLDENGSKEELIESVADEVLLCGVKAFLEFQTVGILRKFCREYTINSEGGKDQLVETLMVYMFELEPLPENANNENSTPSKNKNTNIETAKETPEKKSRTPPRKAKKEKEEKETPSREKESEKAMEIDGEDEMSEEEEEEEDDESSDDDGRGHKQADLGLIKRGVTYVQLFDTYNATQLVDYCRTHNLKCSGKKSMVIKRILQYLDTGDANIGKKRKAEGKEKKEKNK